MDGEWKPINLYPAPRTGETLSVRIGELAPYHVRWNGQNWRQIEYQGGGERFTRWLDERR